MLAKVLPMGGQVPRSGFKLSTGAELKIDVARLKSPELPALVLVFNDDPKAPIGSKPKAPLRADGTDFLEFVKLTPTEPDRVLTFVNRYGVLHGWIDYHCTEPRTTVRGEPVERWMSAAADMLAVVEVWRAWRKKNQAELKKRFRRADSDEAFIAHGLRGKGWAHFPTRRGAPQFVGHVGENDSIEDAAGAWLRSEANGHIEHVQPWLIVDEENGGTVVGLLPQNLRQALWLQFALAVCGQQEYRDCAVCGQPFGFDPNNRVKARRIFCSASCRVKASRQRGESASKGKGQKITKRRKGN
jgi:hypothetical protein